MMLRILHTSRLFVRFNSTNRTLPIGMTRTLQIENEEEEEDDESRKPIMPSSHYVFADSKSARFKAKNKRKQNQWEKELEQRQIVPKTSLSSFVKQDNRTFGKIDDKPIRDTYVTPDGEVREDNFQLNLDADLKEEKEPDEPIPLAVGGRRYPVWFYAGKLKELASQNKVQETLDYFYNEMMDKERVAPNLFCYQVVIGICARNGYLTQAFDLYQEMKNRGFNTVDSRKMSKIFTLLATACYRASDSAMAVDRATRFVDEMKEKGFRIEYRTFNAFIAAFGKHGQLKMAFQLADEMVQVGFIPNEDTYASLLIACSSEKIAGFKYAIEIWRRMLAFGVTPTPFHFGILLNTAYRCGLGSPDSMQDLFFPAQPQHVLLGEEEQESSKRKEQSPRAPSFLSSFSTHDHQLSSPTDPAVAENESVDFPSSFEIVEHQQDFALSDSSSEWWQNADDIRTGNLSTHHLRPFSDASILKPNKSYENPNIIGLRMPRSPAERLMLLGGIPGVLKHMRECEVAPNSIIFATFLELIPSVTEHEQALIHVANLCKVKHNLQFYNMLIRRRLCRGAKQETLQVLELMREQCVSPDEYTFSALAKGCVSRPDGEQLLSEMKDLNLKPNQKVLEAMLSNAFHRINFPLLSLICESHRTYNLAVNKTFLERIEKFLSDIRAKILAMEHANVDNEQYQLLSSSYNRFQKFYDQWLRDVPYAKRFDQKVTFRFDKPNLKK